MAGGAGLGRDWLAAASHDDAWAGLAVGAGGGAGAGWAPGRFRLVSQSSDDEEGERLGGGGGTGRAGRATTAVGSATAWIFWQDGHLIFPPRNESGSLPWRWQFGQMTSNGTASLRVGRSRDVGKRWRRDRC